ncbi:hypothetical protein [Pseudomonas migulae]|uniref:Uncharacterized protein n=1 Tax=Pseudomonas migulae TaxID=78543 RepID=A0ABY8N0B5_9PSED|nr:hypothetical protein [Pseudomonas migulae]WGK92962.1 hypothetical protein MOQ58_12500 [Pseudomonas migulae]
MALLPALKIKEAVGGVIKLTDVPADGATALIPVPDNNFPRENVSVLIELKEYLLKLGESADGYYRVKVPKSTLLDHVGPNKQFKYIIWHDATGDLSDSINYEILRS